MNTKTKLFWVSLGCDKNLVDSEVMLGSLAEAGYLLTDDEEEAEVIVVNTCCFIGDAKEESIRTLIRYGERKEEGTLRALVACGCLAQRYASEIEEQIPEVDAIVGTLSIDHITEAVEKALAKNGETKILYRESIDRPVVTSSNRVLTTGGHYEYLKIAEGCNRNCTYCVIPSVRGHFRSVPMEELLKQAKMLGMRGVKELILVAQETTLYGEDLYGHKALPELLRKLSEVEGIEWIRLLYCYPEEITEELIAEIARNPKVLHYIDMPIQHASDNILRSMGRKTRQQEIREAIAALRQAIPDICIRTTFITGFPGETKDDFVELYRFVNDCEFNRLGVFTYSREEGTRAAAMEHQVSHRTAAKRRDEIMELQQAIAFEKAEAMQGTHLRVMVEGRIPENRVVVARSYMDAPDVDGYVFIDTDRELMSGDMVDVVITGSHEYDLIGELEDEFTQ